MPSVCVAGLGATWEDAADGVAHVGERTGPSAGTSRGTCASGTSSGAPTPAARSLRERPDARASAGERQCVRPGQTRA